MKEIAVVDIETSGFQNQGGLIVEIGVVGLNLETGNIINEFDEIVKENDFGERHAKDPYGWVFRNSDLRYEDVLLANDLVKTLPKIQTIFDKYSFGATAFNKRFDFGYFGTTPKKVYFENYTPSFPLPEFLTKSKIISSMSIASWGLVNS